MGGEGTRNAAVVIAIAAGRECPGLDLGRQMALLQREQAAAMEQDVGVGNAAIAHVSGRVGKLAAEAAEQRAAGVVLGQPFRGADPAVAIRGAAVVQMKGVQHAVADEPVRARRIELRVGPVAVKPAIEFARQFARYFQVRRIGLERNRRDVGSLRSARHVLLHRGGLLIYLYIVKIEAMVVKRNLYGVKIVSYKV